MSRVLIAEDDPLIGSFIERGLQASGMSTVLVTDGARAEDLGRTGAFDLLILDMALPGREGLQVLQRLRMDGIDLPVLVLTGRPETRDVVACLDNGADDYMTKPFRLEELLARIRTRLRDQDRIGRRVLAAGPVDLDLWARTVAVDGRSVAVTAREFAMLEMFVRHAGRVLSREQLLSEIWGYGFDPGTNVVAVHVSNLRKKVGAHVIETVRAFGYRLPVS